ncbi:reverse transcriptase-like protein [Elysia marginata]|uniref:Reverse transcriptase-like protein n=1 Tax=Elysia marginata TaxID=1093978 RepID=A0AAV4HY48_9GAST|nr:reverse transcriptase-like protein [Elysia marginata]
MAKRLKVIHLNVQSIGNKTALVNDLIVELDADIAFITETWLKPNWDEGIASQLRPDGYAQPLNFARTTGQSGGGICVIHRESLDMQCIALTTMTHFECCQGKLFINGRSLLFICIYRPPPSSKNKFTPKQFLAEVETFFGGFSLIVHLPIIIGDFKLHYDNQTETYVCQIRDILRTHLLSQVVNTPTQKKNHILDWVVTPDIDLINNLQVMDKCISDHKVIVFELPYCKPKLVKRTITCRKRTLTIKP